MTELLLAAAAGLAIALLLGWALWARPLAATKAERDTARKDAAEAAAEVARQREERGRHATEVVMLTRRNDELREAESERERLSAELSAIRAAQEERDRAHAAELARLTETFQSLAGKALESAQAQFLQRADARFAEHQTLSETKVKSLLAPVAETLVRYESELKKVEAARVDAYGGLKQQIEAVMLGQEKVSGAAAKLETALRSSGKVAGRWGEEQCRNVLEAAGLVEGIDFETQWSVDGDDGAKQRPDFKINLPGGRVLVIDVKCSIDAYVSAAEADDAVTRQTYLTAHAKAVRTHADGLAKKDYAKAVGGAVEFVVLFVPGENFLGAAVEQDRALMNDFFKRQVVLAGPVNLVAVARTVAALRDQARLAKEAAEIAKLGRDLYDSLRIMGGNFAAVQKSLTSTVNDFNKLVTQADGRLMTRARRFKELGAATGLEDIAELATVAQLPILPSGSEMAVSLPPAMEAPSAMLPGAEQDAAE